MCVRACVLLCSCRGTTVRISNASTVMMGDDENDEDPSSGYVNMEIGAAKPENEGNRVNAKGKLKHWFRRIIMPLLSLISNAILPLLSIIFYLEIVYGKSAGVAVWITLVIDIIRFLVCGYYAVLLLCCRGTNSTHGLQKRLRIFAKIIDKKTSVRFILLVVNIYSLIVMSTKVSQDASTALLAYGRDIEGRARLAGLFFAKVALFFGQQLIQNLKGMEYGVNFANVGGHSPQVKIRGECEIVCVQENPGKSIKSLEDFFDGVFASIFMTSICLGILLLPHFYFRSNINGFNGPSYAHGLPVSTSISRLASFPDRCISLEDCSPKYYGLQEAKVVKKDEISGQVETNLGMSDKVLFLDYQSSKTDNTTQFVNLGLTFLTPTDISLTGMVIRVPQPSNQEFRVCVKPAHFPYNPSLRPSNDPLHSIGKFVVGVTTRGAPCITSWTKDENPLGFFNLVLAANVTGNNSSPHVLGLMSLSQSTVYFTFNNYTFSGDYNKQTWILGSNIKAFVQEFIDGQCAYCYPLAPRLQWIFLVLGLVAMTLIYAIFSVILPWPRIRLNLKELARCFVLGIVFFIYIPFEALKTSKERAHAISQHMAVLALAGLTVFVVPPALMFGRNYSQVSSFITQTDYVHFEANDNTNLPDPPYFSVNALSNGVYGCGVVYYLGQSFAYFTIVGFVFFVGGQLIQCTLLLVLSFIGWTLLKCCGCFRYCCVDLKWLAKMRQKGEQLVHEHDELDSDSSE